MEKGLQERVIDYYVSEHGARVNDKGIVTIKVEDLVESNRRCVEFGKQQSQEAFKNLRTAAKCETAMAISQSVCNTVMCCSFMGFLYGIYKETVRKF